MDAFEGHLGTGAHDVAIHVDHADDWQADSTAGRAGEGCTLTIDGETTIRTGTWHTPIFRVMMVLGGGVTKGLDMQVDMVADTLGVEAQWASRRFAPLPSVVRICGP